MRKHPVCSDCKGVDIYADAYAEWDNENQTWDIKSTFEEGAFCNDCNGAVRLDWAEEK